MGLFGQVVGGVMGVVGLSDGKNRLRKGLHILMLRAFECLINGHLQES
jgi:hypothetical protein